MEKPMRYTQRMIEAAIRRLNDKAGYPHEPYKLDEEGKAIRIDGRLVSQKCYMLSKAYGGCALHLQHPTGGITDVFGTGHVTRKEMYRMTQAYIQGMIDGELICQKQ